MNLPVCITISFGDRDVVFASRFPGRRETGALRKRVGKESGEREWGKRVGKESGEREWGKRVGKESGVTWKPAICNVA
jgi:hypothetical protein